MQAADDLCDSSATGIAQYLVSYKQREATAHIPSLQSYRPVFFLRSHVAPTAPLHAYRYGEVVGINMAGKPRHDQSMRRHPRRTSARVTLAVIPLA